MTDTDMLYMAAQDKRITELTEENKVLMSEADRLIKEKGELLKKSEDMKQLLVATLPALKAAFFAHFEQTNKANELYDKIREILGR